MPSLRLFRPSFRPGIVTLPVLFVVAVALASTLPARADAPGWPRTVESSSGTVVMYQPQAEDLRHDVLSSRAAFSLQKSGDASPVFGVLWFTERVQIDRDSNEVLARSLDVTKVRMPGLTDAEESRYETLIEAEATHWNLSGSLDELQAELAATEKERANVADLDATPPAIRFVPERAVLVAYDGAPVVEPIEGSHLERVANTPFAVVFDPSRSDYYLNGANLWYKAKDPLGPWQATDVVPSVIRDIVPPDTSADDQVSGTPPRVVTATEPTELISTDGPPQYASLVGSDLLYVTNTESDVVLEVRTQAVYVLLAGRWYRGKSTSGPWTLVPGDQLPSSFQRIPPDSPKGHLLASVAGTGQAEDAIADAEIPQTSAIKRGTVDIVVVYDGDPDFEPIAGTALYYAVNTDAEVIYAEGRYYLCDQGVWYVSEHPDGPWMVSDTRPPGLDDIPPTCAIYDVVYVYIYDVTPDVIYCGYLPGYIGCYPSNGTVVYGTGYRYKPWQGHRQYFPRHNTWGLHPRYNPWLGRWSFGYSYTAGFLRVGSRWHPGSQDGQHHQVPGWFGPGGYHRPQLAEDRSMLRNRRPRPLRPGETERTPSNIYNRTENIGRVDRVALRTPIQRVTQPAVGAPHVRNNVYAGRDGKVYRREDTGKWRVNDGHVWQPTRLPATPPARPTTGNSNRYGADRGPNEHVVRPAPRPAPVQPSAPAQAEARPAPAPAPAAPAPSSSPGDLERDYHAREEGGSHAPSSPSPPPSPPQPSGFDKHR